MQTLFSLGATAEGTYVDQSKVMAIPVMQKSSETLGRSKEPYLVDGSARAIQMRFDAAQALAASAAAWPEGVEVSQTLQDSLIRHGDTVVGRHIYKSVTYVTQITFLGVKLRWHMTAFFLCILCYGAFVRAYVKHYSLHALQNFVAASFLYLHR